jgi:hypothetical protein
MMAKFTLTAAAAGIVLMLSSCSTVPEALNKPACALLKPSQVEYALSVSSVRIVKSRVGYCEYAGTRLGSRSRLIYVIYKGTEAGTVPPGVNGRSYGPNPVDGIETYFVPITPPIINSSDLLKYYSGILSASEDGYVIRVTATRLDDSLTGARLALEPLLPQV